MQKQFLKIFFLIFNCCLNVAERPYAGYDRYDMRGNNRDYGYDASRTGNRGGGIGYDQRNFRPWDESYR